MSVSETERRKLWVRAGGRCSICKAYLLEGEITKLEISLGECAHIVGQKTGNRSARSDGPLEQSARDKAENLILLCTLCHTESDKESAIPILSIDKLRQIKIDHEQQIKRLTGMLSKQQTLVIRMLGLLAGGTVELHRQTATASVIESSERYPDYELEGKHGLEIDLREVPYQRESADSYYKIAKIAIDDTVRRLNQHIKKGDVQHVSLFAFARLPLLVYLGSKLDDNFSVDIYQRNRQNESWDLDGDGQNFDFSFDSISEPSDLQDPKEAVLILNVSGTIQVSELPQGFSIPTYILQVKSGTPNTDSLRTRESRQNFEKSIRELYSTLEKSAKGIRKLHVFAAVPISAAIAIGRSRDPNVHPTLLIYERNENSYQLALEIP